MIEESKRFKSLVDIVEKEAAKIEGFNRFEEFEKSKAYYELFMNPEKKYIETLQRETRYVVEGHTDPAERKKMPGARTKAYEVARKHLGQKKDDGKLSTEQAEEVLKAYALEFLNQSVDKFGEILKKEKKRIKDQAEEELTDEGERKLIFQLFNQLIAANPQNKIKSIEDYKEEMTKATGIRAIDDVIADINQNTSLGYVRHVLHKVNTRYVKDDHRMKWHETLLKTLKEKGLVYKEPLLTKSAQDLAEHHINFKYNLPFTDSQGRPLEPTVLGYGQVAKKK